MLHSTAPSPSLTTPFSPDPLAALAVVTPLLAQLAQVVLAFPAHPLGAVTTQNLEVSLQRLCRDIARTLLEHTLNRLEPEDPAGVPPELQVGGTRYRRRGKSPVEVHSTFGTLRLRRWLYEPRDPGERCLFPLELCLGLVAGKATPALAQRVGRLVAQHPQRAVLQLLKEENGLGWSHALLRQVAAAVALVLSAQRQAAQQKQLLKWLREAHHSRGPYQPVLAVGRDGVLVPICGCAPYQEAAIATLAVYNRQGKRLGTAYLGQMPEALQTTLSQQLTDLIQGVLAGWKGQLPRLVYLSDGGQTPEKYYECELKKMRDPGRAGERLGWCRVLDYYHAAEYVTKLAEALFDTVAQRQKWACRMREVLKQAGGLTRLLQSAGYHRQAGKLSGKRQEDYRVAYGYLWKRRQYLDYAGYRAKGIPIGSGVTEAGCKVVASQRLKLSGMKWSRQGGQVVVDLRVVWLSGVWSMAWDSHLQESVQANLHTYRGCHCASLVTAA